MGIPNHLPCLLRNLYAGQEAMVRTGYEKPDWFQIWKGVCQGYILSPCLFNFYAEFIMWNAALDEAQAGIKIAGRNISNLRYADDTTLRVETEEELKSLLIKVKEESEKAGLKLNIQIKKQTKKKQKNSTFKKWRSWHLVPSLHGIRWGNNGNSDSLYLPGLQNHCRWRLQPWNEKMLSSWKKSYDQPRQHIKKQRHYFANIGLSNQSHISSGH